MSKLMITTTQEDIVRRIITLNRTLRRRTTMRFIPPKNPAIQAPEKRNNEKGKMDSASGTVPFKKRKAQLELVPARQAPQDLDRHEIDFNFALDVMQSNFKNLQKLAEDVKEAKPCARKRIFELHLEAFEEQVNSLRAMHELYKPEGF